MKLQVPVIMSRECKEEYLLFRGKLPNDDRQICAGGEEGKKHIKESQYSSAFEFCYQILNE